MFWLFLLVVPLPLLAMHFSWMWQLDHYQYFPFLIIGIGALAWQRWDKISTLPRDSVAFGMIAVGLVFLAGGIWIWSPWLGTIAWVMFAGAWMKSQNQSAGYWGLMHLWPPLLLLIRLPMHLDTHLMSWLQRVSSRLSSLLLDVIELPHRVQGNVFELASGTLFISEACSGVQSLFTMLFCSMFLVAWLRRRVTLLPVYLAAAVLWAGLLNVVRIVAVAVAQEWYGIDLLHGWKHDLLGYICLGLAILLLVSTDRLIQVLAFPVPAPHHSVRFVVWEKLWNGLIATRDRNEAPTDVVRDAEQEESERTEQETKTSQSVEMRWATPLVASAAVVLLIGLGLQVQPLLAEMRTIAKPTAQFWTLDEDIIGEDVGLNVSNYQHVKSDVKLELGSNADVWDGVSGGMQVRVAVCQPYYEWHNLAECYGANGWLLNDQNVIDVPLGGSRQPIWPCDASTWVRSGEHAVLVFSCLDRDGDPVGPPHTSVGNLLGARMEQNRWRKGVFDQYMMIQLWATSPVEYTEQQREHLQELHLKVRDAVRERYLQAAGKPANHAGEST